MKAITFPGDRQLDIIEIPDPTPGPGVAKAQAFVGMRAMVHHYRGCGVCPQCSTGWMQLCDEGVKEVYGVTGKAWGALQRMGLMDNTP